MSYVHDPDHGNTEVTLKHALSLLNATLESTTDGILVVDNAGNVISFNRRFTNMWGIPDAVMRQRDDDRLLKFVLDQMQNPHAFLNKVKALYAQPDAESHDTLFFKDGRVFERYSKPLWVGGVSAGRVWSFRDITKHWHLEEDLRVSRDAALAATQAKSEFLATMSHEIRTPMNSIIGAAGLLSESSLTQEQQEFVRIIERAGSTLITLINDILHLAKVETGHVTLEAIAFDVHELCESTAGMLAIGARKKSLGLICRIAPDVPARVVGDPHRLRQILTNLLGNAIKFTHAGEVALEVTRDPKDPGSEALRFTVTDTGIGIPPEKLGAIFDSFTQGDSSATRRYEGTGLGLAIVRRLAELMGGRVLVESTPGRGSTFSFSARFGIALPATLEDQTRRHLQDITIVTINDNAGSPPGDGIAMPPAAGGRDRRRLLIAEDSEDNQIILQAYFKQTPYDLHFAGNGERAVDLCTTGEYDLVLMDMEMPVMDGYTATRAIRRWELERQGRPTPIIALSAYAMTDEVDKSMEAGCNAHLAKPVSKETLLAVIERFMPPIAP